MERGGTEKREDSLEIRAVVAAGRGQRDMTHGVKNRWGGGWSEKWKCGRRGKQRGMSCEAKRDVN